MSMLRLVREDGSGVVEMPGESNLLGRDASCDVVVADKSVSRRHAVIERRGDAWWVTDQGSANGIFIGGTRVADGSLAHGQDFSLGLVRFRVELPQAAAEVADGDSGGTLLIPVSSLGVMPAAPPPLPAVAADPRDAAAAALAVSVHASPAEVQARLREIEADLGGRIAHAPTPHLRATWTASLEEARAAAALLAPAAAGPAFDVGDLPSAQPVVGSEIVDEVRAQVRGAAPAPARQASPSGPPQSTMIFASLTVILLGLSLFFWLSARGSREALRELRAASDTAKAVDENRSYDGIRKLVAGGALQNGKVALCNGGATPVEIRWLGALYATRGPAGEVRIEKFMSNASRCIGNEAQGERLDLLVPGERKASLAAGSCTWDGQALFVAVEYATPGQDQPRRLARSVGSGDECLDLGTGGAPPAEAPAATQAPAATRMGGGQ